MRSFIAPLILAPLMFAATPVFAQSNPSAEQIINSLKPTGNLTARRHARHSSRGAVR